MIRLPEPLRTDALAALCLCMWLTSGCATVEDVRNSVGQRFGGGDKAADGSDPQLLAIERGLDDLGYSPGTLDGTADVRTEAAIQDFQLDRGLRIDGRATAALLEEIERALAQR